MSKPDSLGVALVAVFTWLSSDRWKEIKWVEEAIAKHWKTGPIS
jgi:hypothetical protein